MQPRHLAHTAGAALSFEALFGRPSEVVADAPGRVNLMGEHTDYNGGYVLPTAIPQRTIVELAPRHDARVRVSSATMDGASTLTYALGTETRTHGWLDYVQGVTVALRAAGVSFRGFDARFASRVPVGAGLSSSAALEISLLRALREAFHLSLDEVSMARLGRAAETDFVGAPIGIMDQMAACLADERTALFLDTRSLAFERVKVPAEAELVVIDSAVAHDHATGDYKTRRAECERAAKMLGVHELRDVGADRLQEVARLPEPLNRRARHVVTENARVLQAVDALRAEDLSRLGALFAASHASMRDDFEVSVPAIDRLVERAVAELAVYGARLTGGGFGGSIVALVHRGHAAAVSSRIAAICGHGARVLIPDLGA